MMEMANAFSQRGDLAHLALFLWASSSSGLLIWTIKELSAANRRFDEFVKEIAAINRLFKRLG